ncbi:hypothetical protein IT399_02080 [Candidatus Nomurabacteria bacterium]|nr:hypothetical protein [Candidatus Nomurabacteria bacterium]
MGKIFALLSGWLLTLIYIGIFSMINIFASGGIVNNKNLSEFTQGVLNASIFIIPVICIISAMLMTIGYFHNSQIVYRWLLLPPAVFIIWIIILLLFSKFS